MSRKKRDRQRREKKLAALATRSIKIFEMNDCEWWAAATLKEAISDYKKTCHCNDAIFADLCPDPIETLGDRALDGKMYTRAEEEGAPTGKISFRRQLEIMVASGCEFPCMFATTEY